MMNMVNNYITLLIETTSKTYPQNGNFYIGYCCLTKQSFLKRLLLCQIFPITGTVLYDSFKYETCFYFLAVKVNKRQVKNSEGIFAKYYFDSLKNFNSTGLASSRLFSFFLTLPQSFLCKLDIYRVIIKKNHF